MSTTPNPGACDAAVVLTPRELLLADAIAERVTERLRTADGPPRLPRSSRLVDACEVAHALGVNLKTVYRHADRLGVVRVGRRLRFDLNRALRSWSSSEGDRCPSERSQPLQTPAPKRTSDTGRRPSDIAHCQLLPVGRRTGAL